MNHKFKTFDELFASETFDKKNKLNRSTKIITENQVEKLENGLSLELIDEMKVPIFKYQTQVTVHGHFPELSFNRIGSYKNIIRNKNGSVGVKYNAIDFEKKQRIYQILKLVMGASVYHNSSNYMAEIHRNADTKEKAIEIYKNELAPIIARVDKTLYYGQITGGVGYVPFFGYFAIMRINIAAIYEKNIVPFLEQITGVTMSEIDNIVTAHNKKKQAEITAWEKEYEKKIELEKQAEKEFDIFMSEQKDFLKVEKITNIGHYIRFTSYGIEYLSVGKKKKLQVQRNTYLTALEAIQAAREKKSTGRTFVEDQLKGIYYKLIESETKKEPETKKENVSDIEIVSYSEKAIAIFGNTKKHKDTLKNLGAKFNPYLNKDGKKVAGWIAPKNRKKEFESVLFSLSQV